jgi:DMSO/TMAO reductase YedYZ molybdopterin-dependent catalytic subunit
VRAQSGAQVIPARPQVTIRDSSGVTEGRFTGSVTPNDTGGLDLTITEHFARHTSLRETMAEENLLCYEMNRLPLPTEHGSPSVSSLPAGTASPR